MNHTYEPPSLIPAVGQERTYALLIASVPLLLILLVAVVPQLASGDGSAPAATSLDGQGGYSYTPPTTDSPAPDPSTAYGTVPSLPAGSGDTTYPTPNPLDTEVTNSPESTGSSDSTASTNSAAGPADTVSSFFKAINDRDYQTAWDLGGKNLDMNYDSFVSGFATTERDDFTIGSVDGDTVSVSLTARQTDGTERSYTGQYTVVDGVITHASMTSAG
ncbi:hypothetical protein BFF78_16300 [Streptomyces fodineus]|uniref:Uncharacterized protein n=1 Tax=Streptomyces fodineus TaxID=1904616 RepID=A0A1D7YAC3_9ACTN|nr:hypothetical protein [Streptomyces fodineus]AOR32420.1 hypothetical protein BFF78_16300 [Streptomyces fodineus]